LNSSLSNSSLSNQALNSSLSNQAVGTNLNASSGTRQQLLTLVPASEQSAQLKDLVQRLAQSRQRMSPAQAAQAYNEENRLNTQSKDDAEKAAKLPAAGAPATTPPNGTPDTTPPGMLGTTTPGNTLKPGDTVPPSMNPILTGPMTGGSDKAYMITSLAAGIKAQGLANLLKTAEDQMRQGKFSTALNTYDTARQVAPNNPFAALGQAFAELGAASYGRAEQDFRQAFQAESGAVLLGTYDLRGFLGEDRLKFVVKDLKDINAKEKNERAAFLLAYIAHNLGDDENAAKLLNDAEQRAGGNDSTISLMRDSWQLKK
jgi:tetratricopeptide (TPR) repeat protein